MVVGEEEGNGSSYGSNGDTMSEGNVQLQAGDEDDGGEEAYIDEQTGLLPRKYNTWPAAHTEQRIYKGKGRKKRGCRGAKKRGPKRQSLTMLWHGVNQLNTGYGWMA